MRGAQLVASQTLSRDMMHMCVKAETRLFTLTTSLEHTFWCQTFPTWNLASKLLIVPWRSSEFQGSSPAEDGLAKFLVLNATDGCCFDVAFADLFCWSEAFGWRFGGWICRAAEDPRGLRLDVRRCGDECQVVIDAMW